MNRYWDEAHRSSVDIVACKDSPWEKVTSYATIGVSDIPLRKEGKDVGVRTELVGACRSSVPEFGNCLATAAFFVINSGWFVAPGVIFPGVLSMYRASSTMKHVLFLPPFLWEGRLQPIEGVENPVTWLLAVPISQEGRSSVV